MICFLLKYVISLMLTACPPPGQTSLLKHIETKVSFLTSDDLSNLYIIRNDVLEKYDNTGKLLYSYSENALGAIDFVDVSDPLKVLVFYKNLSQFAVLDNTLTMNGGSIPLEHYGLEQTSLICTSYDRGFWLYNEGNMELVHLKEDDLSINKTTGNIAQLLNLKIHPNYLLEQNNRVFLNDPDCGVMVFDMFGAYYKTISLKKMNRFQVSGDNLIYFANKKLNTYNIKTLTEDSYPVPDTTASAVRVEKDRMYIQNEKGVDIYEVKP